MLLALISHKRLLLVLVAILPSILAASRDLLDFPDVVYLGQTEQLGLREIENRYREEVANGDQQPLELCECEAARGGPNGLSCEKEGWFISNFQQAGQWLNGGGLVPLSRAICCRPCLPTTLPGSGSNESALAILSLGCHASSNPGSASLRCESNGGSLVSGWSQGVRVPDAANFFYPIGPVDCCTPSLLMSNGDARELERCDCVQENGINCGEQSTGRMLTGFMRWGVSQVGEFVPIAPALCCKSCISDKVIPADSCYDLNFCSGHGVCNLGVCECQDGYGGADCKYRVAREDGGMPQWLILIIIVCSGFGFVMLVLVLGRIVRIYQQSQAAGEDDGSVEDEHLQEPLILGLNSDDEGSVGSEDSSDCDTEDDSMPPPIRRRHQEEPQAVGGGVPVTAEDERQARTEPFEISQEAGDRLEESAEPSEEEQEQARIAADLTAIEGIRRAEAVSRSEGLSVEGGLLPNEEKDGARATTRKDEKDRGGVPGIECSVCLNRPVQVAVVPCGHMCMCRRCSRRLQTCPVCRIRIIRRQRVFLGG